MKITQPETVNEASEGVDEAPTVRVESSPRSRAPLMETWRERLSDRKLRDFPLEFIINSQVCHRNELKGY